MECGNIYDCGKPSDRVSDHVTLLPLAIPRTSLFTGHHIGPQRFNIRRHQRSAPGRHIVLAVGDGVDEAVVLIVREGAQVERTDRVGHMRAVAGQAVVFIEHRACVDLLGSEFLRLGFLA